jgi:anti-sigma factor ChrR (cupin superfamily)
MGLRLGPRSHPHTQYEFHPGLRLGFCALIRQNRVIKSATNSADGAAHMGEQDITKRLIEQLQPIMVSMRSQLQSDLAERDKAVIIDALVDAAVVGARVAHAQLVAHAVEQGIELPESFTKALREQDRWPYDG